MLNDSWAGRNPTRVVVSIEEEEQKFKYLVKTLTNKRTTSLYNSRVKWFDGMFGVGMFINFRLSAKHLKMQGLI
jgi:hypothetical protein